MTVKENPASTLVKKKADRLVRSLLELSSKGILIADTKKAMQEVRGRGIHPFIITSDKKGAGYLKEISPQTQSIILPRVESLPMLLPALYKRLTA